MMPARVDPYMHSVNIWWWGNRFHCILPKGEEQEKVGEHHGSSARNHSYYRCRDFFRTSYNGENH